MAVFGETPRGEPRNRRVVEPDVGNGGDVAAPVGVHGGTSGAEKRLFRAVVHYADEEAVEPPRRRGVGKRPRRHGLQPPLRAREGVVADPFQQRPAVGPVCLDGDCDAHGGKSIRCLQKTQWRNSVFAIVSRPGLR